MQVSATPDGDNIYVALQLPAAEIPAGTAYIKTWFCCNGTGDTRKAVKNMKIYLSENGHFDGDSDEICDMCGDSLGSNSGVSAKDAYIVRTKAELDAAVKSTANSKNYIKLAADIIDSNNLYILADNKPCVIDLNGYTLDMYVNCRGTAEIHSGTIAKDAGTYLEASAHLTLRDLTVNAIVQSNNGRVTLNNVTVYSDKSYGLWVNGGSMTASNVNIYGSRGAYYVSGSSLVLDGVTVTASTTETTYVTGALAHKHEKAWGAISGNVAAGDYYLSGNVTATGNINITSGEVTLCLNGKTFDLGNAHIAVSKGATLTICDCGAGGKITSVHSKDDTTDNHASTSICPYDYATIENDGTVNLISGTVENKGTYNLSYALICADSSAVFNMTGGALLGDRFGLYVYNGTAYVSGGSITAVNLYAVYVSSNAKQLYLSGTPEISTSSASNGAIRVSTASEEEKIHIIANDGAENPVYYTGAALNITLEGFIGCGKYAVGGVNADNAGKFLYTEHSYYTLKTVGESLVIAYTFAGSGTEDDPYLVSTEGELSAALNASSENNYVTLAGDITMSSYITLSGDILDLGTHTLTITDSGYISLKNGTIKNGTVTSTVDYLEPLRSNGDGVVNIEGVTVSAASRSAANFMSGTVNIKDSSFKTTASGKYALTVSGADVTADNVILEGAGGIYSISSGSLTLDGVSVTGASTETSYVTKVKADSFAAYSITLGEQVGINIYMALTDATIADSTAYMLFTLPNGKTVQVNVPEVATEWNGKQYYKFTVGVAVKEMTADIKAVLVTSAGSSEEQSYTVEGYAKQILENAADFSEETITLVKALLNYGAAAQTKLGYKTDALANRSLDEADKLCESIDTSALAAYEKKITGGEASGISYAGTSTVWETKMVIRHYFSVDDSADFTITVNSEEKTLMRAANGLYYIDIEGILPSDMNTLILVQLSDGTQTQQIAYGVYSYIYDILTGDYSEASKAGVTAAYRYSEAACAYLASIS